ncbi:MAG: tyrosine-type recombinase/integrase [Solirubrobacterales bacterium]
MSAFKRNGKWVAKFVLRGEQHWTPGGPWDTKKAAEKAERIHRDELGAHGSDETCESFAARWLREWSRASVSTQANYRSCADRFGKHFGEKPLAALKRLEARSWALTVPRQVPQVIATMYEDARDVGVVNENPFHRLRLPALEREDVWWPSLDEYRALLDACPHLKGYGPEFRAMIQFSAWTGIRIAELFGLQWDDIEGQRVWVRRQRKRDSSLGKPKGGHVAAMPFPAPARVLDDLPRRRDPFVFHSINGQPLTQGTHRAPWDKVRKKAGLQGLRWHSLRHFCATQLLDLGLDHYAVSLQLRHRDGGALVMRRYGHPSVVAAHERVLAAFEFSAEEIGSRSVAGGGA